VSNKAWNTITDGKQSVRNEGVVGGKLKARSNENAKKTSEDCEKIVVRSLHRRKKGTVGSGVRRGPQRQRDRGHGKSDYRPFVNRPPKQLGHSH